jgi:hypothetical protein
MARLLRSLLLKQIAPHGPLLVHHVPADVLQPSAATSLRLENQCVVFLVIAVGDIDHLERGKRVLGIPLAPSARYYAFECCSKDGFTYAPLGTSLKGTPLSTRISAGKPSTRSEIILRKISSVPPSSRLPIERKKS